jgi:SAM-dependent methyltransferase
MPRNWQRWSPRRDLSSGKDGGMTIDWGVGHYESTAEQLQPAATVVIEAAAPQSGERVLDLGWGTGNAALLAARSGADVIAVDPADRLLDVARKRATDAGLTIDFRPGAAAEIPLDEASIDVVVSVFALIFAPDPDAATAEVARVIRPGGRLLFSAWVPGGAIARMNAVAMQVFREAMGLPEMPLPFGWHDLAAVRDLADRHGFTQVEQREHAIVFSASSPAAYVEAESVQHPMAVSSRAALAAAGQDVDPSPRMIEVLEEDNEDPSAFRATSRYVVNRLVKSA